MYVFSRGCYYSTAVWLLQSVIHVSGICAHREFLGGWESASNGELPRASGCMCNRGLPGAQECARARELTGFWECARTGELTHPGIRYNFSWFIIFLVRRYLWRMSLW